ncbi:MAG: hypothetical protein IPF62_08910 [Bacteroidetes bacterium]|nr:hypothetical protein [Bacteroidota bacterium]MBK7587048.1 hypothetical protein [Bacteroidota bacterium]
MLNKNHLLVNHKLVSPSSDFKIPENNANSIRSILNYLNKRGEINKIHTWLDEKEQKVLSDAIKNNQLNAVNAIFTNIHIEQEPQYTYLTYYPISRFLHEIPINLTNFKNMVSFVKYADENSKDLYMAEIIDTNLYIFKQQDTLVKQSVVNLLASLKQWESKQDSIDDAKIPFSTKLKIMSNERFKNYAIVNDSLILMNEKYKIYLNNIELYKQDSVITLKNINGILLY